MRNAIVLAVLATVLAVAVPSSLAAPLQEKARGSTPSAVSGGITVRSKEILKRPVPTNGGVAGTGHFTISGVITDKGTETDYRTVKGSTALIRRVAVAKKGTITFLIRINLTTGSAPWTITSGTKTYKGLHGKGTEVVDKYYTTPAIFVLKGTVSQ
jgi:hypothetical protein